MLRAFQPTDEELQNEQFVSLNADTSDMYGLIHARYIRSPEGKLLVKLAATCITDSPLSAE